MEVRNETAMDWKRFIRINKRQKEPGESEQLRKAKLLKILL